LQVVVGREPQFPVQVPGMEARRPDLVFYNWEHGRDLYIDVVGSSPHAVSYRENFVPGGAVARGASHKMAWSSEVLARQTPRVVFQPFAFDTFGGLHASADELLKRLQCLVSQASVAHEGLVWFSAHRRLGFAVSRAVGRQLASRVPWGGLGEGV
jgi:hypothetical protein